MKKAINRKRAIVTEMPEVDMQRAKMIGTGTYFRRVAAESRYIQLDLDVFKFFKTAKAVNDALRQYLEIRRIVLRGMPKRKSP